VDLRQLVAEGRRCELAIRDFLEERSQFSVHLLWWFGGWGLSVHPGFRCVRAPIASAAPRDLDFGVISIWCGADDQVVFLIGRRTWRRRGIAAMSGTWSCTSF